MDPKVMITLFLLLIVNVYFTLMILNYTKRFENLSKEQEFYNNLMNTPEYKNQNMDKKFVKFFSKINKVYLSDEIIEKIYYDALEMKNIDVVDKDIEKRRFLYAFLIIVAVINVLFTFVIFANDKINEYIKVILIIIQVLYLYYLYEILRHTNEFKTDDHGRKYHLSVLRKVIFYIWISFLIVVLYNLGLLNTEKSSSNNTAKSNSKSNSNSIVENILNNNEKFINTVMKGLN
jgi:hypothetical protein